MPSCRSPRCSSRFPGSATALQRSRTSQQGDQGRRQRAIPPTRCHPGESRDPTLIALVAAWVPASAGMTPVCGGTIAAHGSGFCPSSNNSRILPLCGAMAATDFAIATLPPLPRTAPWGTLASVAFHGALAAALLLLSPLGEMALPPSHVVTVDIVSSSELEAQQQPAPTGASALAEPGLAMPTDRLATTEPLVTGRPRNANHHRDRVLLRQHPPRARIGADPADPHHVRGPGAHHPDLQYRGGGTDPSRRTRV